MQENPCEGTHDLSTFQAITSRVRDLENGITCMQSEYAGLLCNAEGMWRVEEGEGPEDVHQWADGPPTVCRFCWKCTGGCGGAPGMGRSCRKCPDDLLVVRCDICGACSECGPKRGCVGAALKWKRTARPLPQNITTPMLRAVSAVMACDRVARDATVQLGFTLPSSPVAVALEAALGALHCLREEIHDILDSLDEKDEWPTQEVGTQLLEMSAALEDGAASLAKLPVSGVSAQIFRTPRAVERRRKRPAGTDDTTETPTPPRPARGPCRLGPSCPNPRCRYDHPPQRDEYLLRRRGQRAARTAARSKARR